MNFTNPYNDTQMTYDISNHRYKLTEDYLRDQGIDLSLILDTENSPNPSMVPELFLNWVSMLVYENIYSYGRNKDSKEYIINCGDQYRNIIRDAMLARILYIQSSGDLSNQSAALISQGTRIDRLDLIASPVEEQILRSVGLLHRGDYFVIKDKTLVY